MNVFLELFPGLFQRGGNHRSLRWDRGGQRWHGHRNSGRKSERLKLWHFTQFLLYFYQKTMLLDNSSVSCPIFQWLKYLTRKVITPMLIFISNRSYTFKTRLLESAVLRKVNFFMIYFVFCLCRFLLLRNKWLPCRIARASRWSSPHRCWSRWQSQDWCPPGTSF